MLKVVKYWPKTMVMEKFVHPVQFDNGKFGWSYDGKNPMMSDQQTWSRMDLEANGWTHDELYPYAAGLEGDGIEVVDKPRCKYNKVVLPQFEEKLDLWVRDGRCFPSALPIPKYQQPVNTQLVAAMDRVVKQAQRSLRSLPLCDITGQPVEIMPAVVPNVKVTVGYFCRECWGDEDDVL